MPALGDAARAASGLKNWPPACRRSSATMTLAPARARSRAADRPAGPAPTTSTSQRDLLGRRGRATFGRRTGDAGSERTSMPAATLVRQARWLARPSTVTRQSKHAPMPQNGPRGAPDRACAHRHDVGRGQGSGDGLAGQRLDLGARRSGGGPARRPAACSDASGAWQMVYNGRKEERHEEISRHLHGPDHALHGRRQEGRRGGAGAPGRFPDRGGHPRPDPAGQHRRVPERDARRAAPDRRDRGQDRRPAGCRC